jgi:hypothetical protein
MKLSASVVALCLTACQDDSMMMGGPGDMGMPQMHDSEDPRDDPYLGDINNSWGGPLRGDFLGFTFFSMPGIKTSSSVVTGSGSTNNSGSFQVDGIFYDHMVHLIVIQDAKVLTLDGVFIDIELMDLTLQETQERVILHCSTIGGQCK